jgi:hypothetical protein
MHGCAQDEQYASQKPSLTELNEKVHPMSSNRCTETPSSCKVHMKMHVDAMECLLEARAALASGIPR